MTSTIGLIRADINAKIDTDFAQPIYDTGVPTLANLVYKNGVLNPYLVLAYNDITRGSARSFSGTRGDDHIQAVNIFSVAPTADIAGQLQIKLTDDLLGYSPKYAGELYKRPGGGIFQILDSANKPQAYVSLTSFACTIEILNVT